MVPSRPYAANGVLSTSRQDRFAYREQRRWGDGAYWGIAAPVLWLDPLLVSPIDEVVEPVMLDLWDL